MRVQKRNNQQAVTAASNGPTVSGYAAVFNEVTDLGRMYERIEPGAFNGADMSDVRLLINHEGMPLARTAAGTMALLIDQRGLRYIASLDESERSNALASAARRGDISQSSFAFTIERQRFEERNGKPLRVIEKVGRVLDVGPVSYPAYEGTEFKAK